MRSQPRKVYYQYRISDARLEWIVALTMASSAYSFALSGGVFTWLLAALIMTLAIISLIIIFAEKFIININYYNTITTYVLAVYMILNVIVRQENYNNGSSMDSELLHITGFIVYLFMLNWMASNINIIKMLSKLATVLFPLIIIAAGNSIYVDGRLEPFGVQPNWWGELTIAFTVCSFGYRQSLIRAAAYTAAAILLLLVQSRSGMIGWAAVIGVEVVRNWNRSSAMRRVWLLGLVTLAAVSTVAFTPLSAFVSDRVLLLNNSYRGLDSGLTGRVTGWGEALDAYMRAPVLGYGMGLFSFSHNGYLQILSEGGSLLAIIFFIMLIIGMYKAWREINYFKWSAILSFCGYIAFQPRIFNLDLISLIFWLSLREWKVTVADGERSLTNSSEERNKFGEAV